MLTISATLPRTPNIPFFSRQWGTLHRVYLTPNTVLQDTHIFLSRLHFKAFVTYRLEKDFGYVFFAVHIRTIPLFTHTNGRVGWWAGLRWTTRIHGCGSGIRKAKERIGTLVGVGLVLDGLSHGRLGIKQDKVYSY